MREVPGSNNIFRYYNFRLNKHISVIMVTISSTFLLANNKMTFVFMVTFHIQDFLQKTSFVYCRPLVSLTILDGEVTERSLRGVQVFKKIRSCRRLFVRSLCSRIC